MPKAELPANDRGWPGWNCPAAIPRAEPRVDGGAAKFVKLKMLKISARNSMLRVSAKGEFPVQNQIELPEDRSAQETPRQVAECPRFWDRESSRIEQSTILVQVRIYSGDQIRPP